MAAAREFGSVRQLPSGRWQVRYRAPDGRRLSAHVTFTTKKSASAWLADTLSDIERGRAFPQFGVARRAVGWGFAARVPASWRA